MLSIDEAIEQFKYDAECNRADLDLSYAEDNEQVAEWLEELKELRNMTAGHLYAVAFSMGYLKAEKEARNKAIDDCLILINANRAKFRADICYSDLYDSIVQLKAGGGNGA